MEWIKNGEENPWNFSFKWKNSWSRRFDGLKKLWGPDIVPDKYVSQINWLRIKVLDFFYQFYQRKTINLTKWKENERKYWS